MVFIHGKMNQITIVPIRWHLITNSFRGLLGYTLIKDTFQLLERTLRNIIKAGYIFLYRRIFIAHFYYLKLLIIQFFLTIFRVQRTLSRFIALASSSGGNCSFCHAELVDCVAGIKVVLVAAGLMQHCIYLTVNF